MYLTGDFFILLVIALLFAISDALSGGSRDGRSGWFDLGAVFSHGELGAPRRQPAALRPPPPRDLPSQDLQQESDVDGAPATGNWRAAVGRQESVLRDLLTRLARALEHLTDACLLQPRPPQLTGIAASFDGETDWEAVLARRSLQVYNSPAQPGLSREEADWLARLHALDGPLALLAQLRAQQDKALRLSGGNFLAARLVAPLETLEAVLADAVAGVDAQLPPDARERMRQRVIRYAMSDLPVVCGNIARQPQFVRSE